MLRAGKKAVFIIRRRTNKGWFLPGSSRNANQYSEKPFALPVGAANQMTQRKIMDSDNYHKFTSKSGNLWLVAKKGYKDIRTLAGKQTDHVTMQWSGRYMRDFGIYRTVIGAGSSHLEIGWKNPENQRLATFHEVMGAGKSKRLHKILGLLKKEEEELQEFIARQVMKMLNAKWAKK